MTDGSEKLFDNVSARSHRGARAGAAAAKNSRHWQVRIIRRKTLNPARELGKSLTPARGLSGISGEMTEKFAQGANSARGAR